MMETIAKGKKDSPRVRFVGFSNGWVERRVGDILEEGGEPVELEATKTYREIGIRSHGKGIFHKEPTTGKQLGDKRCFWVEKNALAFNIVFAWEQAVALTSDAEAGFIASHRFPMYHAVPSKARVEFLLHLFLSQKGKWLLESASPGGAGRNKTLGNKAFADLKVIIPEPEEQQKIAAFLGAVDRKIQMLKRKQALLEQYKKGVVQQLFAQELRFKRKDGGEFPDWEEKTLGEVCNCHDNRRKPLNSVERQRMQGDIPYWGANNIVDYVNDFIFDETIVLLAEDGGYFEDYRNRPIAQISHGKSWVNNHAHVLTAKKALTNEFLYLSLVNKDILAYINAGTRSKLNKSDMLQIRIDVPSLEEQTRIAGFLMALDAKVAGVARAVEAAQRWKKGLLQQMFV